MDMCVPHTYIHTCIHTCTLHVSGDNGILYMNSLRGTCTVRVIQGNVIENATFAFVYYIILFVFFYFLILFLDVVIYEVHILFAVPPR